MDRGDVPGMRCARAVSFDGDFSGAGVVRVVEKTGVLGGVVVSDGSCDRRWILSAAASAFRLRYTPSAMLRAGSAAARLSGDLRLGRPGARQSRVSTSALGCSCQLIKFGISISRQRYSNRPMEGVPRWCFSAADHGLWVPGLRMHIDF